MTKSGSGQKYTDPVYDEIEAKLEKKYGLQTGIMSRIRTKGERSNADQVSEAGARTVYQIIPGTRDRFKKTYGVDAYASKEAAAEVAALHLRDSYKRTGSWTTSVAEYHGGPNQRNWGSRTKDYVGRVTGMIANIRAGGQPGDVGPDLPDLSSADLLNTRPADFDWTRRPIGPVRKDKALSGEASKERLLKAVTGGDGIAPVSQADQTTDLSVEKGMERQGVTAKNRLDSYGFNDYANATVNGWLGTAIMDGLDRDLGKPDPEFAKWYMDNADEIEDGFSWNEIKYLREAQTEKDLYAIRGQISRDRVAADVGLATGHPLLFGIGSAVVDPAGWAVGLGIGKAAHLAKVSSGALAAAGRTGAARASFIAENIGTNLAITAGVQAAGDHVTLEDYGIGAMLGATVGIGLSPLIKGKVNYAEKLAELDKIKNQKIANVRAELGPDATPQQIQNRIDDIETQHVYSQIQIQLADIDDAFKVLPDNAEDLLTADAAIGQTTRARFGLEGMVDDAEAALTGEIIARAEQYVKANPPIREYKTVLSVAKFESIGTRLANSESPVMKWVAGNILENTTGSVGRRRTAAMSQAQRFRIYSKNLGNYDAYAAEYRKVEGRGVVSEAWDAQSRRRFDRAVFEEIEARRGTEPGTSITNNTWVARAADEIEDGFTRMAIEQKHVGTLGSDNLPSTGRGYIPRRASAREFIALDEPSLRAVRAEFKKQFMDPKNNFDEAFAERLAKRYVARLMDRAKGAYDVPLNLRDHDAMDAIEEALAELKIDKETGEKFMARFTRGGAGYTKARLDLDLQADIGDGRKLVDLFDTDVVGLYRQYARRTAGEVALAQYGIRGTKGWDLMRQAAERSGATIDELKALDQARAEFFNTPFGSNNSVALDNIRTATSLARLGGMVFTQVGETANALVEVGVNGVLRSVTGMPELLKDVRNIARGGKSKNPILASLDTLGGDVGMDGYLTTRALDIKDNDVQVYNQERIGVLTKGLRSASHAQSIASGHRIVLAAQTRGMAEQIIRKAIRFAKEGKNDKALDQMGIGPKLREAMRKDMDNFATFRNGKLEAVDFMNSKMQPAEIKELIDAVERGASQIIQRTYIGETGYWAHDGLLKLLTQFRTFSITAVEKQWGRRVVNMGAVVAFGALVGSMSFAVPIYYARIQARMLGMSESERKEYADRMLDPTMIARATINYASSAGLLGDMVDTGGGFVSAYSGDEVLGGMSARGGGRGKLIGGVVAPGVGLVEDIWTGVHNNPEKAVKALPGANLPYVVPLTNLMFQDD